MGKELPDIERLVLDAYKEGFRAGIAEGRAYDNDTSSPREAPRHVIEMSYEVSASKTVAILVADKYEL